MLPHDDSCGMWFVNTTPNNECYNDVAEIKSENENQSLHIHSL